MASSPSSIQSGLLQRLISAGLDLLYPPRCVGCGQIGTFWCDSCDANTSYLTGPCCRICGSPRPVQGLLCRGCQADPMPLFVRSAAHYAPPITRPILALKYPPTRGLAAFFAHRLHQIYVRVSWSVDVIVPVPLSDSRQKKRGFNQGELIGREFARLAKVPQHAALLRRIRRTPSQVGLTPIERRDNLESAFEARPEVSGARVLLIDDLYTTGATLRACSNALLDPRVRHVHGLTVARA